MQMRRFYYRSLAILVLTCLVGGQDMLADSPPATRQFPGRPFLSDSADACAEVTEAANRIVHLMSQKDRPTAPILEDKPAVEKIFQQAASCIEATASTGQLSKRLGLNYNGMALYQARFLPESCDESAKNFELASRLSQGRDRSRVLWNLAVLQYRCKKPSKALEASSLILAADPNQERVAEHVYKIGLEWGCSDEVLFRAVSLLNSAARFDLSASLLQSTYNSTKSCRPVPRIDLLMDLISRSGVGYADFVTKWRPTVVKLRDYSNNYESIALELILETFSVGAGCNLRSASSCNLISCKEIIWASAEVFRRDELYEQAALRYRAILDLDRNDLQAALGFAESILSGFDDQCGLRSHFESWLSRALLDAKLTSATNDGLGETEQARRNILAKIATIAGSAFVNERKQESTRKGVHLLTEALALTRSVSGSSREAEAAILLKRGTGFLSLKEVKSAVSDFDSATTLAEEFGRKDIRDYAAHLLWSSGQGNLIENTSSNAVSKQPKQSEKEALEIFLQKFAKETKNKVMRGKAFLIGTALAINSGPESEVLFARCPSCSSLDKRLSDVLGVSTVPVNGDRAFQLNLPVGITQSALEAVMLNLGLEKAQRYKEFRDDWELSEKTSPVLIVPWLSRVGTSWDQLEWRIVALQRRESSRSYFEIMHFDSHIGPAELFGDSQLGLDRILFRIDSLEPGEHYSVKISEVSEYDSRGFIVEPSCHRSLSLNILEVKDLSGACEFDVTRVAPGRGLLCVSDKEAGKDGPGFLSVKRDRFYSFASERNRAGESVTLFKDLVSALGGSSRGPLEELSPLESIVLLIGDDIESGQWRRTLIPCR